MTTIIEKTFDEERALYGSKDIEAVRCRFDGPADGESAFKESSNIKAIECYYNLRYPFWHDENLEITGGTMTDKCRAALWYSKNVRIHNLIMHGTKAIRECSEISMENCDIVSPEFGWSVEGMKMRDCKAESEYFMMRSTRLDFENVILKGKYSFQYINDSVFTNCQFDTKDSMWHAKNVHVKNCEIKGEYMAWYCENVTFENCVITGTQPFCYCKNLKLLNCKMLNADLCFEKSEVDASLTEGLISVKNPKSGTIRLPSVEKIIKDDPEAKGRIIIEPKE